MDTFTIALLILVSVFAPIALLSILKVRKLDQELREERLEKRGQSKEVERSNSH